MLYVAMTRAEEALFVGGALGSRDKGEPPEDSWYARLRAMFPTGSEVADPHLGRTDRLGRSARASRGRRSRPRNCRWAMSCRRG